MFASLLYLTTIRAVTKNRHARSVGSKITGANCVPTEIESKGTPRAITGVLGQNTHVGHYPSLRDKYTLTPKYWRLNINLDVSRFIR